MSGFAVPTFGGGAPASENARETNRLVMEGSPLGAVAASATAAAADAAADAAATPRARAAALFLVWAGEAAVGAPAPQLDAFERLIARETEPGEALLHILRMACELTATQEEYDLVVGAAEAVLAALRGEAAELPAPLRRELRAPEKAATVRALIARLAAGVPE